MKVYIIGGGPAGLYAAILLQKKIPSPEIVVFEKNPPNVTWGWGVVFSDETLVNFLEADGPTYEKIVGSFASWEDIDVHFKGRVILSGGHRFYGVRRMRLLQILQERCVESGIEIRFNSEIDSVDLSHADLVIATDGVNSKIRSQYAEHFHPDITSGKNRYIWLATTKVFESFTFIIRENEHGLFIVHAYPFDRDMSTFIVETDETSWRTAGLDRAGEEESVRYCEDLFANELAGNRLYSNKSSWINFRRVKNDRWNYRNLVLLGDAAHTAHFSIGSGTKLAMEDAIALAAEIDDEQDVPGVLARFYEKRWLDVAKLQRAADVSQSFFEDMKRWLHLDPEQFAFKLLSRSKRVTHANLKRRDQDYILSVDRWFADHNGCANEDPPPPPMFTPFRLRGLHLANRVVVSPMCQYSSLNGMPEDWHLVHIGSRAIGGAGLVFTEMTDVSEEARISPGCAGLYTPEHAQAWKRIVQFVHNHTPAKIGIQLGHAGRKGSTKLEWEGPNVPLETGNWPILAASPIPWSAGSQVPKEMDRADMDEVLKRFVRAAQLATDAGFDILEIHMAHGYLLSGFISPLSNFRKDEYGGSLENRMRYPLEIFDAVRRVWPDEKPMSVRISAHDWAAGGFDPAQAVDVARLLKEHGCDIIDVSSGQTTPDAQPVYGRMYQAPFADRIRHEAGIPTISVGNIQNWDHVNTLLASGQCDLCALARPHLYDPYFTLHAAAEQNYDVPWPNQYLPASPQKRKG